MKVIFGTICKNIQDQFQNLYEFVESIYETLPDAYVCVYENNSTDDTKSLLLRLQRLSSNITIQTENLDNSYFLANGKACTWDNLPCRMEMIAYARNKLLGMINTIGYEDEDRIVMFDADMAKPIDISKIVERLRTNADAIFANGLRGNGSYYDMYALRTPASTLGPDILGEQFWRSFRRLEITEKTPVYSAFGGLCIYRGACIRDNAYSAIPTKDFHDVTKEIISKHSPALPSVKTHAEGVLLGVYLFDREVFYVNNSGYNYPVLCEHGPFHATMYKKGLTNMYIDPGLLYYSTH